MALTATLVFVGHNSLRYLLNQSGGGSNTLDITTTGAASPDLLTDSVAGPLKKLARAALDGYGGFAAGALTQAQARALWQSDMTGANPAAGDPAGVASLVPTAKCRVSQNFTIDANVSGGNPILTITAVPTALGYLDIEIPNAIGA